MNGHNGHGHVKDCRQNFFVTALGARALLGAAHLHVTASTATTGLLMPFTTPVKSSSRPTGATAQAARCARARGLASHISFLNHPTVTT